MHLGRVLVLAAAFWLSFGAAFAAETIPPAPRDHFNDYAKVVRPETARMLNGELAQFERDTSNQIVVAIYPKMQSASSIEDYTVRVFEAWHPGAKKQNNGAVLFVFSEDRKLRIATGYGLEGALPDALCKQIIENEITPRFRAGDFDGGLIAGVRAMMAAARGEYRGTGRLAADAQNQSGGGFSGLLFFIVFLMIIAMMSRRSRRHVVYGPRGRRDIMVGGWGGGWGGGGSSWGGGGGGGSFSGGGGSTGGGGASGSW